MSLTSMLRRACFTVIMGAILGLTSPLILGKHGIPMSETDVHKGEVL
jgi:hypothetical protein